MTRKFFTAVSLGLAVTMIAACASKPASRVIVDTKGVDMSKYYIDRADCEAFAEQVRSGEKIAQEAGKGAAVGGAVGGIYRGSDGIARGAGAGAVVGGVRGYEKSENEQFRVVRNCLRGRGYRVLN